MLWRMRYKNKILKVAIICELKNRELQFLSILKKKLELSGYEARIIPQRILCGIKILKYRPDIIIVNGLRSSSNFYRQILIPKKLFNATIVSIYSEQVGTIKGIADTYDNKKILESVDAHITWGEGFAEGLNKLKVPREKIWILGSMALDLPYYLDNEENKIKSLFAKKYNLDESKKWILVSDNIIRKGDQVVFYNHIRNEFNCGIKKIAEILNDCEFIFRPHPDNKKSDLKKLYNDFSNYSNIKIIGDEHNMLWTCVSEAMIIWRSTSSIEAWAAKKEVFALQTSENKFDYWHKDFIPNFESAEDLGEKLQEYFQGLYSIKHDFLINREKYMQKWFYNVDGKSIDRICCLIDTIQNKEFSKLAVKKYELIGILKAYLLEVQWFVIKLLKHEYEKFNIKNKEITNNSKHLKILNHSRNKYHIKLGKLGNYLIPIK